VGQGRGGHSAQTKRTSCDTTVGQRVVTAVVQSTVGAIDKEDAEEATMRMTRTLGVAGLSPVLLSLSRLDSGDSCPPLKPTPIAACMGFICT